MKNRPPYQERKFPVCRSCCYCWFSCPPPTDIDWNSVTAQVPCPQEQWHNKYNWHRVTHILATRFLSQPTAPCHSTSSPYPFHTRSFAGLSRKPLIIRCWSSLWGAQKVSMLTMIKLMGSKHSNGGGALSCGHVMGEVNICSCLFRRRWFNFIGALCHSAPPAAAALIVLCIVCSRSGVDEMNTDNGWGWGVSL